MNLWSLLSPPWQEALVDVKDQLTSIEQKLANEVAINPQPESIFRALGQKPNQFRVIIVGQDPYPNLAQAMGLAFSIPDGISTPSSLRNIQKELLADLGLKIGSDLTYWADQGVLLLNRILTCRTGHSLSHQDFGWQVVTDEVIKTVLKVNPNTVAVLWGNYAKEVSKFFNPNLIISSPHPSGLSAHRGFLGSKPFSKTNSLLIKSNQTPINWA